MESVRTTIVKNLLTGEKNIYVNKLSLAENIINEIIVRNKQTTNLLNPEIRGKYKPLIKESVSNITGRNFAFCEKYNLHASFEN